MKFCALVSGGKDSVYTIQECVRLGHELLCIAHLSLDDIAGPDGDADSFMYQSVGGNGVAMIAAALDVDCVSRNVRGRSRDQSLLFDATNIAEQGEGTQENSIADAALPPSMHPGDEVADLYLLLVDVKRRYSDVTAVASGAILSTYQRARVEAVCAALSLTSLAPLWERDQTALIRDMAASGLDARIIKVASVGLRVADLGASIRDPAIVRRLTADPTMVHPCGEGGEYETFVVDAPVFKTKRLEITNARRVVRSADTLCPLAHLVFDVEVVPKGPAATAPHQGADPAARADAPHDGGSDSDSTGGSASDSDADVSDTSHSPTAATRKAAAAAAARLWVAAADECPYADRPWRDVPAVGALAAVWAEMCGAPAAAPAVTAAPAAASAPAPTGGAVLSAAGGDAWGSAFVVGTDANGDAPAAAAAALSQLPSWVFRQAVYVHVFVRSMSAFAGVNVVYSKYFPSVRPPARACVEVPRLPQDAHVAFVVIYAPTAVRNGDAAAPPVVADLAVTRDVLHAQSLSGWAPAAIGPYGQGFSIDAPCDMTVAVPADVGGGIGGTSLTVPTGAAVAAAVRAGALTAAAADLWNSRLVAISGTVPLHPPTSAVIPLPLQPHATIRHVDVVMAERTALRASISDSDVVVVWGATRDICSLTAQLILTVVAATPPSSTDAPARRAPPSVLCVVTTALPRGVGVEVQCFGHARGAVGHAGGGRSFIDEAGGDADSDPECDADAVVAAAGRWAAQCAPTAAVAADGDTTASWWGLSGATAAPRARAVGLDGAAIEPLHGTAPLARLSFSATGDLAVVPATGSAIHVRIPVLAAGVARSAAADRAAAVDASAVRALTTWGEEVAVEFVVPLVRFWA